MDHIDKLFFGALAVIVAVFITVLVWQSNRDCVRFETVKSIGGCSWSGRCGFVTENYNGTKDMPTVGEMVCVEYE